MGEPGMEKIIMDQEDNPFKSRAAAKKTMETMGLDENYKVVPVAGGDGFALMLKTNETPAQPKTKRRSPSGLSFLAYSSILSSALGVCAKSTMILKGLTLMSALCGT